MIRFARYAAPPHRLGYCGPSDRVGFNDQLRSEAVDDLRHAARDFHAAVPYLELLAGAAGSTDPLAADVVEAYWIGNPLLGCVQHQDFGRFVDTRFRRRSGRGWSALQRAVPGGVANHAFHVLVASPWVGMLRAGIVDEPLAAIDSCRISWGTVVGVVDEHPLVERQPLGWSNGRLVWEAPRVEQVVGAADVPIGSSVSLHWGRVCEPLDARQLAWLRAVTAQQLAVADSCGRPC